MARFSVTVRSSRLPSGASSSETPSTWSQHLVWMEYAYNVHVLSHRHLSLQGLAWLHSLETDITVLSVQHHFRRCQCIWHQVKAAPLRTAAPLQTAAQNKRFSNCPIFSTIHTRWVRKCGSQQGTYTWKTHPGGWNLSSSTLSSLSKSSTLLQYVFNFLVLWRSIPPSMFPR